MFLCVLWVVIPHPIREYSTRQIYVLMYHLPVNKISILHQASLRKLYTFLSHHDYTPQLGQAKTKQASKLSYTSQVLACPSC